MVQVIEFSEEIKSLQGERVIKSQVKTLNPFLDGKGAHKELKKRASLVSVPDEVLGQYLASENISCKLIPPHAPNFGEIWEAGIKSFKFHLKRTISDAKRNSEEFLTVFDQIAGILNSRSLSPLSSEPPDYEPLTPGHFLIGRPINSIVEPQILALSESRLLRWQN
ncbi:uncharacterized protein LOC118200437 [Stegodyphus dumicola]|uniref:uncharacterized protein LOC118200437 n=1 Tax=Stegodyphus dumicola TaxID=202533 RepID=UPI0015A9D573|nr:uncharacterized protein LOC118200437 [Stegodyphus dumicola]